MHSLLDIYIGLAIFTLLYINYGLEVIFSQENLTENMNIKKRISNNINKVSFPLMEGNDTCDVPGKEAYFKQELIDRIRAHLETMSQPIARRGVYYNRPPADITILQEKLSSRIHDCHCPPNYIKEQTMLQKEKKQKPGLSQSCPLKTIKEEKLQHKEKKKIYTRKLKKMKLKPKPHKPNL